MLDLLLLMLLHFGYHFCSTVSVSRHFMSLRKSCRLPCPLLLLLPSLVSASAFRVSLLLNRSSVPTFYEPSEILPLACPLLLLLPSLVSVSAFRVSLLLNRSSVPTF